MINLGHINRTTIALACAAGITLAVAVPPQALASPDAAPDQQTVQTTIDAFLMVDNVKGSSTADGFKDQIPVYSFSYGVQAGARGAARVSQDLDVITPVDQSAPVLFLAAANGSPYTTATLIVRRADKGQQSPFLTVTLSDVRVTSYNVLGGESTTSNAPPALAKSLSVAHDPLQEITLSYGKITINNNTSNTKAGYDFAANKPT